MRNSIPNPNPNPLISHLLPQQAPTAGGDIFGDAALPASTAPPAKSAAVATPSLQFLQDLALMEYSDMKRYKGNQPICGQSMLRSLIRLAMRVCHFLFVQSGDGQRRQLWDACTSSRSYSATPHDQAGFPRLTLPAAARGARLSRSGPHHCPGSEFSPRQPTLPLHVPLPPVSPPWQPRQGL